MSLVHKSVNIPQNKENIKNKINSNIGSIKIESVFGIGSKFSFQIVNQ